MLSLSQMRQFGSLCNGSYGGDAQNIIAGAGQDGLENDRDFVLIPDAGGKKRPESATPVWIITTTLAAAATLSLVAANGQHATNVAGAGVADFDLKHSIGGTGKVAGPVLLATGGGGGTTAKLVYRGPTLVLVGADVAIRFQDTFDLSAGSIDTVDIQLMILWGGYGKEPTDDDALVVDSNA